MCKGPKWERTPWKKSKKASGAGTGIGLKKEAEIVMFRIRGFSLEQWDV